MTDTPLYIAAGSTRILFVMAAEPEYGPHLRARFEPLMTGVGPVESAMGLAGFLGERKAANDLPALIVSLGSAGSRSLEQTEICQASSVSYRDMDASPLGFEKGRTPFLDLPVVLPLEPHIPGIKQASLSTGANIVSGAAYDAIDAEMVDMETYAQKRVAMHFDIPLIGLRGISDGKAELRHVDDWTEYLHVIDEKLAGAVDLIVSSLGAGL
ncbi:MAG: 5'-methylthioadenosine/S-adenosylhomocysteine nucleosidase [Rhizobiaceae bacterium]